MKLNRPHKLALLPILSCCFAFTAYTADDNAVINLSYTHTAFVRFTGTAPGDLRTYDNDDITNFGVPKPVNIGTMGLESNVGGLCDLTFTTANTFKLLHTVTNNNLGNYKILYKNAVFNEILNPPLQISCNSVASDIDFELNSFGFSNVDPFLDSGIYRDVITVEVATQ